MPRRSSTRQTTVIDSPPPLFAPPAQTLPESLATLRTHWKWAAFSQFFITFSHLFPMDDVGINDIENDLAFGTNVVLPRIMQRLLYTLTYDRKINLDNWQTALRKQYYKRDPQANPIGPEPIKVSPEIRSNSVVTDNTAPPSAATPSDGRADLDPKQDASTPNRDVSVMRNSEAPSEGRIDSADSAIRDVGSQAELSTQPPQQEDSKLESDGQQEQESEQGSLPEQQEEPESSLSWLELPVLARLDSLHLLTEWQFQNPTRLRQLMRSDDENASWRIEPIGYDNKRNVYWHVGERLWIQRALPAPPKSLKRKRTTGAKPSGTASKSRLESGPAKRARIEVDVVTPKARGSASADASSTTGRHSRAAKARAKLKLDAQAKELAELNRQAAIQNQGSTGSTRSTRRQMAESPSKIKPAASSRPLGTRISARLRGAQDDEWQPIPQEWLAKDTDNKRSERKGKGAKKSVQKTGLESDEDTVSDLTELSEESESAAARDPDIKEEKSDSKSTLDEKELDKAPILPEGFIEWETICVTLSEWEHIAERFEKATYYLEKALYKRLVNDIVPVVTEQLREIEKKRRLEEALTHRKRSSRLAIKESEKEEARAAAKKRAEEEEKMSRARRLEARRQKEEEDRVRRETAREQRRKEREARDASRKTSPDTPDAQVDVVDNGSDKTNNKAQKKDAFRQSRPRYVNGHTNGTGSGSRTPIGDDWELDCEICHRHGINLDDGTPMMSCGVCSKWQHIICHDRADQQLGRPKRDWDIVEFICQKCHSTRLGYHDNRSQKAHPLPQGNYSTSFPAPLGVMHTPYHQPMPQLQEPSYGGHYSRPANGIPYARGQVSDIRSGAIPSQQDPLRRPQSNSQPTIAFSHYQPQEHGFTPTSKVQQQQPRPPSFNPYLHAPSHGKPPSTIYQYSDTRLNGQSSSTVQHTAPSETVWNITTPAHTPGYAAPPYVSRVGPTNLLPHKPDPHDNSVRPVATVDHQWAAAAPQAPPSDISQQHYATTQFRYHPTSYQSPP